MSDLYDELLAACPPSGPQQSLTRRRFASDLTSARKKERGRRSATSQWRALSILSKRYPDEYRELYVAFLAEINAEAGPLPGDPE